ncbi:uncharacterized protein GO595_009139 [Histomonas meleagridis]|uniref:uncharacterized protein n=1 Tax=Histomonas meleagridis TaxID=135588 RepID=UPI003559BD76|nr:hypothetical protein GO595_009139 [Histomonas meleagridis]
MKKNSSNDDPRNGIDIQAFRQSINDNGVEDTRKIFHISREKIHAICKLEGIAIPSRGRPSKEIKEEEVNFCLDYKDKYHVGYQRTAESAKRHNIATTEWSVRKIFTEQKLLCYKKPEKAPPKNISVFSLQNMLISYGMQIFTMLPLKENNFISLNSLMIVLAS